MAENTSTARRNSHTTFLCVVFRVLTWAILLVLFFLRIKSINIPIDYIVSVANTTTNSSIVYIKTAITFFCIISILEISKLDEILNVTPGDSQRTLSELVNKVIAENRFTFDGIAETQVDDASDDAVEVYRRLVKEMFADRVIHWGRVTVFFALTIFFRDRFTLILDDEAKNLMSEYFFNWMEERQSTLR